MNQETMSSASEVENKETRPEIKQKDPIAVELGRRGGLKVLEKHGKDHYKEMARISGLRRGKKFKKEAKLVVKFLE